MKRAPRLSVGRRRGRANGFTLTELMIVVAMVGVLAALALVGYKRYIDSSKTSEATQMVAAIRSAEESFRAETLSYFGKSTSLYPQGAATLSSKRWSFQNPAHPDAAMWQALNVTTDGAVRFGYMVHSGGAGPATYPAMLHPKPPTLPASPTEPWYVVQARGDPAERGSFVNVLGYSFSNEIFVDGD